MRMLHTSDWHLGQHLMTRDRRAEHRGFLDWLLGVLTDQRIDLLVMAGDIFDTGTPPNYALELYYDFLRRLPDTPCRQTVIIGGNHDSVATLHAPRNLLRRLNVHVVGSIAPDRPDDQIIAVPGRGGLPTALLCAVPFLRDRDIRNSGPGERHDQKSRAVLDGIRTHYHDLRDRAVALRAGLPASCRRIPIIATGHLFTAGGELTDGVRELYVGSLGEIDAASFPAEFDYVALGHLHRPQWVRESRRIRYSGAPIPLSFSEASGGKEVTVVELERAGEPAAIESLPVPLFQEIRVVTGDLAAVTGRLASMQKPARGESVWVEVRIDAAHWLPEIQNSIAEAARDLPVEILAIRNTRRFGPRNLGQTRKYETLSELTPREVFLKRLETAEEITADQRQELVRTFTEILDQVTLLAGGEE